MQSVLLGQLTEYFVIESPSSDDTRNAYLYAMGMSIIAIIVPLIHVMAFLQGQKLGMMTRTLMSSAIYQKVSHHT